VEIPKNLQTEIWEYCRVNNITNVDAYTLKILKQGFTADKFGSSPIGGEPKTVEVEKIVEKIVEKEVIKEIPVEKIVYQDKEVFVTDDEAVNKLSKELGDSNITIGELKSEVNELYRDLDTRKNETQRLQQEIKRLVEKIEKLEGELEEEKKKPKQEDKKDIYSEKRGTFGSNLSDLWNKKR
jgi:chromosome segregation ATPase